MQCLEVYLLHLRTSIFSGNEVGDGDRRESLLFLLVTVCLISMHALCWKLTYLRCFVVQDAFEGREQCFNDPAGTIAKSPHSLNTTLG